MREQELASPWDIVKTEFDDKFMIVMAGTHQIWCLDLTSRRMTCVSGSGAEGNLNTSAKESSWAQPSGISQGQFENRPCYFIADSESSAVRVLFGDDFTSVCIAGATSDDKDLAAVGDIDGVGH